MYNWVANDEGNTEDDLGTLQRLRVSEINIHPDYEVGTDNSNDMAVIYLAHEVEVNERIMVACLPSRTVRDGEVCLISGWGTTSCKLQNTTKKKNIHPV